MLTMIIRFFAALFGFTAESSSSTTAHKAVVKAPQPVTQQPDSKKAKQQSQTKRPAAKPQRYVPKLSVLPLEHQPSGYGPLCQPIFKAFALLKNVRLNREQLAAFVRMLFNKSAPHFRLLVKQLLEAQGYSVALVENSQHDLIIQRDGHRARVHTNNNARSLTHITQRAFGVSALMEAQKHAVNMPLMVFTAGRSNEVAKEHAKASHIMLVEGRGLARLLAAYDVINLSGNACKEVKHAA